MPERTVSQAMSRRHIVSVGPGATVYEAACVMTSAHCGSVLVIDPAGTMLGILTERDLMTRVLAKAVDPATTAVTKVMTPNPRCVGPEMKVADAVVIMMERGFTMQCRGPLSAPERRSRCTAGSELYRCAYSFYVHKLFI